MSLQDELSADFEGKDLNDMGITDTQLAWLLHKVTKWITGEGGTFRCFVEELGSDYSTVYCTGGMDFTNAVFDLKYPEQITVNGEK